jgi:hypothetical protein
MGYLPTTRGGIERRLARLEAERALLQERLDTHSGTAIARYRADLRARYKGRNRHIINRRYVDGWTLEQIGDEMGLTRERVRQICTRAPRWLASLAAQRKAARERLRAFAATVNPRYCPVCGKSFIPSGAHKRYCSHEHYQMMIALRRVYDPDFAAAHHKMVARWMLRNADNDSLTDDQLRYARRVVADEAPPLGVKGRWYHPGSKVHGLLRECWDNDWPIVERFHPDIITKLEAEIPRGSGVDASGSLPDVGRVDSGFAAQPGRVVRPEEQVDGVDPDFAAF